MPDRFEPSLIVYTSDGGESQFCAIVLLWKLARDRVILPLPLGTWGISGLVLALWNLLLMVPKIHIDSKKVAYFNSLDPGRYVNLEHISVIDILNICSETAMSLMSQDLIDHKSA